MQQDTTPSQSEAHAVSSFLLVQYVAIGLHGLEECLGGVWVATRLIRGCVSYVCLIQGSHQASLT